jgi:phospholipid-binding lipoprotein MlaA
MNLFAIISAATKPINALERGQFFLLNSKWLVLALCLFLGACGSVPRERTAYNPVDPFEPFNRQMFKLNDRLDTAALKPVAQAYQAATPAPARAAVSNFMSNLTEPWSLANALLQGNLEHAGDTMARFAVNTFFGMGGLIDWGSELGIERHRKDFGQTLARWGVKAGPYVVLPLLGPTTLRDAATRTLDPAHDPLRDISPDRARTAVQALRAINSRAGALRASQFLDDVALDKYTFTRDAFLQLRNNEIWEGEPPESAEPAAAANKK